MDVLPNPVYVRGVKWCLIVALCLLAAPVGAEGRPAKLTEPAARHAIAKYLKATGPENWGTSNSAVGRCQRFSRRRILCRIYLYGSLAPSGLPLPLLERGDWQGWATATLRRGRIRVVETDTDGTPAF